MPDLSVVIPARDERGCIGPVLEELDAILDGLGLAAEIVVVDDGSTDGTDAELTAIAAIRARLRPLRLDAAGGQTAALRAGLAAARGGLVAMMDADGQNDPADLPGLLETLAGSGADLVQGDRTAARCDGRLRRVSSAVGRIFRRRLLGDRVRDTGCTLRVMRRPVAEALGLEYRGLHRFVPELARQHGFTVIERPVGHRPRRAGRTHYGVRNRALAGLADLLAVRWMQRRRQAPVPARPLAAEAAPLRRVS